jgi:hypothetical protein
MLQKDSTLYFSSIIFNGYQDNFWNGLRPELSEGGTFMLDLAKRINPNRFVTRNGEWSIPWKQEIPPGFEMPAYDVNFSKSFEQVTDERALEIKRRINENSEMFAVMYSGGIDSTIIMAALIKNLTTAELTHIIVCASSHAIIENPMFWKNFIWGKFRIRDSSQNKYDDLMEAGYIAITADEGDCIFGTALGLTLYSNYDQYLDNVSSTSRSRLEAIKNKLTSADVHYSEYKDIILQHFSIASNPDFAESFYDKFEKNIQTSTVPIQSLHDYFWWMIFNIKYLNCSVRGAIYYNDRVPCERAIKQGIINWFNGADYQRWSMVNNNNREKIDFGPASYKMAARRYIHDLDKNDWYFYFKIKLESLGLSIVHDQTVIGIPADMRPNARFGMDSNYNLLYIDNPNVQDFIKSNLIDYKKDW